MAASQHTCQMSDDLSKLNVVVRAINSLPSPMVVIVIVMGMFPAIFTLMAMITVILITMMVDAVTIMLIVSRA